jgi:hypothetical protein
LVEPVSGSLASQTRHRFDKHESGAEDGVAFCFLLRNDAYCLASPVALRRSRMIDTGSRQLPVLHVSGDNQERE